MIVAKWTVAGWTSREEAGDKTYNPLFPNMPIGTFAGLGIAFSGLQASQRNLDITGQNISNANTEGYSRQRVLQQGLPAPTPTIYGDPLHPPMGVEVTGYQRVRDLILDRRLYDQAPLLGEADAQKTYLSQLEGVYNEPSDNGVRALMDRFWNGWKDAANNPTGFSERQIVLDRGAALAQALKDARASTVTLAAQVNTDLAGSLSDINKYAADIGTLSLQIRIAVASGEFPNDLQDQRDLLLDKLADLGNITVQKYNNGDIDVTFGTFALVTTSVPAVATPVNANTVTAGKMRALNDLATTTIPAEQAKLDALAGAIITQVNTQHTAGFDITGAAGLPFFSGVDATNIAVNLANPSQVALAQVAGAEGDGRNGIAISNIGDLPATVGPLSIRGAYQAIITAIGSSVDNANRQSSIQQALTDMIRDRRDSVSGVSLDEEMSNLMRYQTGYGAAARAITTMDDMLDKLINHTGRAGL